MNILSQAASPDQQNLPRVSSSSISNTSPLSFRSHNHTTATTATIAAMSSTILILPTSISVKDERPTTPNAAGPSKFKPEIIAISDDMDAPPESAESNKRRMDHDHHEATPSKIVKKEPAETPSLDLQTNSSGEADPRLAGDTALKSNKLSGVMAVINKVQNEIEDLKQQLRDAKAEVQTMKLSHTTQVEQLNATITQLNTELSSRPAINIETTEADTVDETCDAHVTFRQTILGAKTELNRLLYMLNITMMQWGSASMRIAYFVHLFRKNKLSQQLSPTSTSSLCNQQSGAYYVPK
ncbi:uncharacterized protein RSE6_07295 [Rhynchosporium secalis]|uniref:Uncharacterized protein n=1 Tax=Rhynchosporium secalis TaxID=38038 RepID=A0A1E1MCG7_RHYSE|nr:uncharacterized protein RSE6_07295 [Rhynchosporium secalis]